MPHNSGDLLTTLRDNTGVTSKVGTYGTPSAAAIFYSDVVPKDYSGASVNFYLIDPVDDTNPIGDYGYSVNCRAAKQIDALLLQSAVVSAINRVHTVSVGAFFTTVSLPLIRPQDPTDLYNAPIEVRLKARRA